MSQVSYNGITLPYAYNTSFSQEAVYDDVGHTDRIYTKFDITVQCLINTNYISTISSTIAANSGPASIMKAIRQKLLQQRKQLQVTVGSVDLIPAAQSGNAGTCDAKNGPMPQSCNINQITETTFLLSWHVVAHYWENNKLDAPNTNRVGDNVLFNRWTESVEIDECNYSKITRHGTFTIRTDNLNHDPVDVYREQMALLPIPAGCKRISSRYEVSADGTSLTYDLVDQEVYLMPPFPAYKAKGSYTEETSQQLGFFRRASCRLTLEGSKSTDQGQMLQAACLIAVSKLNAEAKKTGAQVGMLEVGKIDQELYENRITIDLRCILAPCVAVSRPGRRRAPRPSDSVALLSRFSTPRVLTPPANTPLTPPKIGLRGDAIGFVLHAAAYYDPSVTGHAIDQANRQLNKGVEPGQEG